MQQYAERVLVGESGTVTQELKFTGGEFLALDLVTITGTIEVEAGIGGFSPIGLTNALTEAVEADAAAAGLWYAFIGPYTRVRISATSLDVDDEIWIGIQ